MSSKLSDPDPDPGSGKSESLPDEVSRGEFGYSSGVESGLAQTDSTVARQLQPAETVEETTRFLLELRFFLDDFLGGS